MAAYTIKNLRSDVADAAKQFGHSPHVEARFARDDLDSSQTAISFQRFAPGVRQPFAHRHREHEETYVVVEGAGEMWLAGETVPLRHWDAIRVAPKTVRAFIAGPEGLSILAIGPHGGGDAEVVPAPWSDEASGA